MKLKELLEEVFSEISVGIKEADYFKEKTKEFISELKKRGLNAEVGGSLAKGTMIKSRSLVDIDIFVVFDSSEDMPKLLEVLKKSKLPGELKVLHGSRDYYQINCSDFIFELIPVLKNKDPTLAENVTDVSLSHVKYVREEIKKNPALAREIMLSKAFARANKVYGAESYVKGFSGYALEVLVIYFGSFIKFLKYASKKKVIDPKRYFRNEAEVMRELNESKLMCPLVLVDPTNKFRNVTAGLSEETYQRFLSSAKSFLNRPHKDFFSIKEINVLDIKKVAKKEKAKFLEISFSTEKQEGDIAGTKMRKVFDFLTRELIRKEQKVLVKEFVYPGLGQKSKGYLVIKEKKEVVVSGPSRGLEDASEEFRKSRGKTAFLKGKQWFAKEKVSLKKILEKVKEFEEDMNVKMSFKIV